MSYAEKVRHLLKSAGLGATERGIAEARRTRKKFVLWTCERLGDLSPEDLATVYGIVMFLSEGKSLRTKGR
jgi:hypothetical protein